MNNSSDSKLKIGQFQAPDAIVIRASDLW